MELKFLKESVVKKLLLSGKPDILNYFTKIIFYTTGDSYEYLKDHLEFTHAQYDKENGCCFSFFDGKSYYGFEVNYDDSETAAIKTMRHARYLFSKQQVITKPIKMINITARFNRPFERKHIVDTFYLVSDDGIKDDIFTIYDIDLLFYKDLELADIMKDELLKNLLLFVTSDDNLLNSVYKDNPEALAVLNVLKKMKSLYISKEDILELADIL